MVRFPWMLLLALPTIAIADGAPRYELERARSDSRHMLTLMDDFADGKLPPACPASTQPASTVEHPRYECFRNRAREILRTETLSPTGYLLLLAVGAQVISYDQDHTKELIAAHSVSSSALVVHRLDMIELMNEIARRARSSDRSPAGDDTGSASKLGELGLKIDLLLKSAASDVSQLPAGTLADAQRKRLQELRAAREELKSE